MRVGCLARMATFQVLPEAATAVNDEIGKTSSAILRLVLPVPCR